MKRVTERPCESRVFSWALRFSPTANVDRVGFRIAVCCLNTSPRSEDWSATFCATNVKIKYVLTNPVLPNQHLEDKLKFTQQVDLLEILCCKFVRWIFAQNNIFKPITLLLCVTQTNVIKCLRCSEDCLCKDSRFHLH